MSAIFFSLILLPVSRIEIFSSAPCSQTTSMFTRHWRAVLRGGGSHSSSEIAFYWPTRAGSSEPRTGIEAAETFSVLHNIFIVRHNGTVLQGSLSP